LPNAFTAALCPFALADRPSEISAMPACAAFVAKSVSVADGAGAANAGAAANSDACGSDLHRVSPESVWREVRAAAKQECDRVRSRVDDPRAAR
jgi:hypothetical protein